jgi:hypothetical protein
MDIYIYIEKKVFYNIEGQLRGLPGSNYPKTCAPQVRTYKMYYKTSVPARNTKKLPPS